MIKFDSQIDYDSFYKDQAGGGLPIKLYKRQPRLRGYGLIGSLVQRFAFPILKALGRQALPIGQDLITDVMPGLRTAKDNKKKRTVSAIHNFADKIDQSGIGRKRRRRQTSTKSRKATVSRRKKGKTTRKKRTAKIVGAGRKKRRPSTPKKRKTTKRRKTNKTSFNDIFK